jgi:hypothetical protein
LDDKRGGHAVRSHLLGISLCSAVGREQTRRLFAFQPSKMNELATSITLQCELLKWLIVAMRDCGELDHTAGGARHVRQYPHGNLGSDSI